MSAQLREDPESLGAFSNVFKTKNALLELYYQV